MERYLLTNCGEGDAEACNNSSGRKCCLVTVDVECCPLHGRCGEADYGERWCGEI
jgi:hypothetical protein